MKTKHLRTALLFVSVAATAVSCAKKEEVAFEVLEQRSLDAWMEAYAPDASRWSNGMYVETLENGSGSTAASGDWIRINFTGTDLWSNVFVTRSEEVAALQGTRRSRTFYEPLYTQLNESNSSLTQSQISVLLDGMSEGDSVRIYFPSHLGYGSYGSSYGYGYEGQNALGANVPAIIDMKLVEVVPDPNQRERAMVQTYANEQLGVGNAMISREGTYNNRTRDSLMYCKVLKPNPDLEADTIRKDSTVNIYYIGRFVDGFIFDTNIDSVAWNRFREKTAYSPLEYTPSSSRDSYIQAFYEVFDTEIPAVAGGEPTYIRYGDWVTMVFTSAFGYGIDGSYPDETTANQTIIQPFTPLIFEFYAARLEDE